MYGYEKNISSVFEIYKQIFTLRMGDSSVQDHFATLQALLDKLDIYQPLTSDVTTMRRYREELAIATYFSSIDSGTCVSGSGPNSWCIFRFES